MKIGRKKQAPAGRRRPQLGEQSPAAFSYYTQRSSDRQNVGRETGRPLLPKSAKSIGRTLVEKSGLFLLLVAIVAGTINSLMLSTSARIVPINTQSTVFLHDDTTYSAAAKQFLGNSIWNYNKITIDTKAVSEAMKARFPELANVSITLPLIAHRPVVYIQPSPPALILQSNQASYVIGANGTALLPSSQLPGTVSLDLPLVNDQSNIAVHPGKRALSSDTVAFIQMVTVELKAAQIAFGQLTLPAGTSELDVQLKNEPYFIKFNTHASLADIKQQAGTFIAVKRKLDSQHIVPSTYVDVRVLGRAYYK